MSHSRMIVLGSINMDVVVTAPRHPQQGETVFGDDLHVMPGGKEAAVLLNPWRGDLTTPGFFKRLRVFMGLILFWAFQEFNVRSFKYCEG